MLDRRRTIDVLVQAEVVHRKLSCSHAIFTSSSSHHTTIPEGVSVFKARAPCTTSTAVTGPFAARQSLLEVRTCLGISIFDILLE